MPIKRFELEVSSDPAAVWAFHSSAEALTILTPPDRKIRLISQDLEVQEGAIHEFQVKIGPFWLNWKAKISDVNTPFGFTDSALKSPFKSWTHKHEFVVTPNGTLIRDSLEYVPPLGFLGVLADRIFISKDLDRVFAFRHEVTLKALG